MAAQRSPTWRCFLDTIAACARTSARPSIAPAVSFSAAVCQSGDTQARRRQRRFQTATLRSTATGPHSAARRCAAASRSGLQSSRRRHPISVRSTRSSWRLAQPAHFVPSPRAAAVSISATKSSPNIIWNTELVLKQTTHPVLGPNAKRAALFRGAWSRLFQKYDLCSRDARACSDRGVRREPASAPETSACRSFDKLYGGPRR